MLLHLFHGCSKDESFRRLVRPDSLVRVLQPLLCSEEHGGARFLSLLSLSFFINDDAPEEQKQMLKLENSDIQLLQLYLAMKQITAADALHLVKKSTVLHANLSVLQKANIPNFVSQFLDDSASTEQGKLAAEIITCLQSTPSENNTETQAAMNLTLSLSPDDLLESFLPLLAAYNAATAAGDLSLDLLQSCVQIYDKLQSLEKLLGTDMKVLLSISESLLEAAARELSRYIRLHLMGRFRFPILISCMNNSGHPHYVDVSGCCNPKCIQTLHSCGKLLIDICRYTTHHQVVVHEGLVGQLLTTLENFKECKELSNVGCFNPYCLK